MTSAKNTVKNEPNDTLKSYPASNILGAKELKSFLIQKGSGTVRELKIPDHIQAIRKNAFYCAGCDVMSKLILPPSLEYIEPGAFHYCSCHLREIILPKQNRYYFRDGFLIDSHTQTLLFSVPQHSIHVPSGIKRIAPGAFCYPEHLWIPKTVEFIDLGELNKHTLNTIEIEDGHPTLRAVDNVLYSPDFSELFFYLSTKKNSQYKVHPNTKLIAPFSFGRNEHLRTVILPEGLEIISSKAFIGCYFLRKINLPDSLHTIEDAAFFRCENLHQITLPSGVKSLGKDVFTKCGVITNNPLKISIGAIKDIRAAKEPSNEYGDFAVNIRNNPYAENYCKINNIKYKNIT